MLQIILKPIFLFILMTMLQTTQQVQQKTIINYFQTQFCTLNIIKYGLSRFDCPTKEPHKDIIRRGLVLAQLYKQNQELRFTAQLSDLESSQKIQITFTLQHEFTIQFRISYFILLIKQQPTNKYMDILSLNFHYDHFSQNGDYYNSTQLYNQISVVKNIKTETIFSQTDQQFKFVPYLTSLSFQKDLLFSIQENQIINSQRLNIQIKHRNQNNLQIFTLETNKNLYKTITIKAISLVLNNQFFSNDINHVNYVLKHYQVVKSFNSSIRFYDQTHIIQKKCLIGLNSLDFNVKKSLNVTLKNLSSTRFQFNYQYSGEQSNTINSQLFCLYYFNQRSLEIKQVFSPYHFILIQQKISSLYLNESLFDMPSINQSHNLKYNKRKRLLTERMCGFGDYFHPSALSCIFCGNIVGGCDDCTWTTCQTCTNALYIGRGLQCSSTCLKASISVANCNQADSTCTSCIGCDLGFYLSAPATCTACPTLTNCQYCFNATSCFYCGTNNYIDASGSCQPCSTMVNCMACDNGTTCKNCSAGYPWNTTSLQCQCSISYWNLTNCTSCLNSTHCLGCTSGKILFSNGSCQDCVPSSIHPNCSLCNNVSQCSSCHNTYVLLTLNSSSNVTCQLCIDTIPYCKPSNCSNQDWCNDCQLGFHTDQISGTQQYCQFCNISLGNTCIQCSNNYTCINCIDNSYYLSSVLVINSIVCDLCSNAISHCLNCTNNLTCINCKTGYVISIDSTNNATICSACHQIYYNCQNCSISNCTSCIPPYDFGPGGICDNCLVGYELIDGNCFNQPGCLTSIIVNNVSVCLSCASNLHFYLNPISKKCNCMLGFIPFYQPGHLMSCKSVCGDGIFIPADQQCDDGNTISGDGCSSTCTVQNSFTCSATSNSTCTLNQNFVNMKYNHVTRVIGEHKGILSYTIMPIHPGLQKMKWDQLIKLNFSSTSVQNNSLKYSYDVSTGQLKIQFMYLEEMQNVHLSANLTFDPALIVSVPFALFQNCKLNGINALLLLESEDFMQTQKNVNLMAEIFVILVLIQFYVGSYFHKMIGLETINVVQLVYFMRMLGSQYSRNVLGSLNSIKYAASGYQNSQLFQQVPDGIIQQEYGSMSPEFLSINLQKYFLMNVNISLVPIILVYVIYAFTLARKYYQRAKYMVKLELQYKDLFTILKRSAQWTYDHFVFPYTMMINAIVLFNYLAYLQVSQNKSVVSIDENVLKSYSFPIHTALLLFSFAIYAFELFQSYQAFRKYKMTSRQRNSIPKSIIEKVEHDQNNIDRANYHPLYILIYLLTYTIYWFVLIFGIFIQSYDFGLEMLLGLNIFYLVMIYYFQPYHESIKIHNKFLLFNQFVIVIFLLNGIIFGKINKKNDSNFLLTMYVMIVLLVLTTLGGFIRIFLQKKFRTNLQETGMSLYGFTQQIKFTKHDQKSQLNDNNQQHKYFQDLIKYNQKKISLTKNSQNRISNQFLFQNQLNAYKKDHKIDKQIDNQLNKYYSTNKIQNKLDYNDTVNDNDVKSNDYKLISLIRQQYARKRQQMLLKERKQKFEKLCQDKRNLQKLFKTKGDQAQW